MTDSKNTTNPPAITRRTALAASLSAGVLLAGVASANAATVLPGASDAGPELLALEREWWEARVAHDIAFDAHSEAQGRYFAEVKRLSKVEATRAALDTLKDRCGVRDAEAAQAEALDRLDDVERRISEAPARTLGDLVVKALLVERNRDAHDDEAIALARAVLAFAGPDLCRRTHFRALGVWPEAAA